MIGEPLPRRFASADEARAYVETDEFKQRFQEAQRIMRTLSIEVTAGDAEMVVSWAEEALKGKDNPVAHAALGRLRDAFNDAAREAISGGS